MTDRPTALRTALAYHHAWTGGDFEAAMAYVADDIVFHAPPGHFEGAEKFRAFMGPFARTLRSAELFAAYGDETEAVLMYDTSGPQVDSAPGAEHLRIEDGRIISLRIIFDRAPFIEAERAQAEREHGG